MAFEKIKLFGKIEVEVLATATGTLTLSTNIPGGAMASRVALTIGAQSRGVYRSRLPYNTLGHLIAALYAPTGQSTLYGARVWARELPGGQWQWYELPVIDTPVEFTAAALPIPPTPEEWQAMGLPIPPTAETWQSMDMPIPPTSDDWASMNLPIPPTSEEWKALGLPIPPTSDEWSAVALPIKATPPVSEWADVPVDK